MQQVASERNYTFESLIDVAKACSLKSMNHAVYDVRGGYRRNMWFLHHGNIGTEGQTDIFTWDGDCHHSSQSALSPGLRLAQLMFGH